jgi:hypothetical protein
LEGKDGLSPRPVALSEAAAARVDGGVGVARARPEDAAQLTPTRLDAHVGASRFLTRQLDQAVGGGAQMRTGYVLSVREGRRRLAQLEGGRRSYAARFPYASSIS